MLEQKNILIKISSDYITLGQFLKFTNVINNGGEAKHFILNNDIFVNDVLTKERGKKLHEHDKININNSVFFEISK